MPIALICRYNSLVLLFDQAIVTKLDMHDSTPFKSASFKKAKVAWFEHPTGVKPAPSWRVDARESDAPVDRPPLDHP